MRSRVLLRLLAAPRSRRREEVVQLPDLLRNGLRGGSEVRFTFANSRSRGRRVAPNDAYDDSRRAW